MLPRLLFGFALFFAAIIATGDASAQGNAAGVVFSGAQAPAQTLLLRVDTFPTCAKVRRCWRTDTGRLRCGLVDRCRECKWVKQCTRAGCSWREKCRWGRYKAPFKPN